MSGLNAGSIKEIASTQTTSLTPTLQVIQVKRIGDAKEGALERYRLIISDGECFQQAMLATQLNEKVKSGEMVENCHIKLLNYLCQELQGKKIIIVLNLEIVSGATPRIGNPVNVENGKPLGGAAPAAAAAPPASYSKPAAAPTPAPYARAPAAQTTPKPYSRGPVSHSPLSAGSAQPIASLNPYRPVWTIKAIINSKNRREYKNARGAGHFVNFEFKDDSGRIKAIAFKEDADRLAAEMEEGKTYLISKGQIKPANKKFCDFHDYEITLGRETTCSPVTGGDALAIKYDFVQIAKLEDVEANKTVDICAIATSVSEIAEITAKKDGRQLQKRNIQLVDQSNAQVELTLWGKQAVDFPQEEGTVVVARGAYVSDWGGRSLGCRGSTSITLAPDLPEAHAMRAWYDANGAGADIKSLSTGRGSGGGTKGPNTENRLDFAAAQAKGQNSAEKKVFFNNRATITLAKQDGTIAYPSCPETKKKLIEISDGEWKNEATGKSYPEPQWRYCLSMKAEDHAGHAWMTAFDDQAVIIVGKDAKEVMRLKGLKEQDPAAEAEFSAIFDEINGKDYIFRCVMKEEIWQDEARMKTSILGLDEINYVDESNFILKQLHDKFGVVC